MKNKYFAFSLAVALVAFTGAARGEDSAQDARRLAGVVVAGEDWQPVADGLGFADGPSCDAAGNFYFSDLKKPAGIFKVAPDGTRTRIIEAGMSGTKFGADGRLYACGGGKVVAYTLPGGEPTGGGQPGGAGATAAVLAEGVQPNDLVVTHRGHIYFTETGKKQVTFLDPKTGKTKAADVGINKPNGIGLSPDQKTLAVSDYGGVNVWTFSIQEDGTLGDKKPAMTMRAPAGKPDVAGGDGMTTDAAGRYYVTSALGVQVFAPAGDLLGVLPKPHDGPLTSAAFAGPNLEYLYVTCGAKVFRRKTHAKGVLAFQAPAPTAEKK